MLLRLVVGAALRWSFLFHFINSIEASTIDLISHRSCLSIRTAPPFPTQRSECNLRRVLCSDSLNCGNHNEMKGTNMDLSRLSAAPLTAYYALKENSYGAETDSKI